MLQTSCSNLDFVKLVSCKYLTFKACPNPTVKLVFLIIHMKCHSSNFHRVATTHFSE